ncbi:cytochrome c oxidase assembly protein subunit 15 [Filimonas lacunae]|uniref:Cytochrome c oxidase assembly protein subunit 15 n=1 Tax=Filimonas lacunae TaxID=477680 RepID=A0A173MR42_9BACT|nr:COX15/CtaA family protein [Filimonas lacunae]BAV09851.1 heme A synthase, cytochrome oxidase biogenesis protein [Filimonas lacunae]SIS79934.1 cytochrome c oxidase assembly protein subunit 15 [Filimonas lacunae]
MSNTNNAYLKYTRFVLFFVFVVIAAGGIVRMTQSGMGCPDWPRCFGSWIPPTNASQLPADYEKYLRQQDIDHEFNAVHTWTEYINRLLGAILGFLFIIHTIWSARKFFSTRPSIFWMSFLMLVATGVQAWLGKRIVDANLAVVKVTTHMLVALVIAIIPVVILRRLQNIHPVENKGTKWLAILTLLLLLVQIVIGTEVREQIDEVSRALHYEQRELWINRLDFFFTLHKTCAWIATACCVGLFWRSLPYKVLSAIGGWIFVVVLTTLVLGLSMLYLNVPAIAQPLHLICSSLLFVLVYALILRLK